MNNFSYENQGANTFLVYSITEDKSVDPVSLGMLTNNKINGLAKVLFMQIDKSKMVKYNVSSKITLKQYFSGVVNKTKLLNIFFDIIETVLAVEDYMIDIKTIIMDSEYIFIDTRTGELNLICVPLIDYNEIYKNPIDLFKEIMFTTNFDQTENCDYVAKIINYVNSTQNFSYTNFKMLVDSLRSGTQSYTATSSSKNFVQEKNSIVQPLESTYTISQPIASQQEVNIIPVQSEAHHTNADVPPRKNEEASNMQGKNKEKDITMLQLLMHYSKENAEKYKSQKSSKQSSSESKIEKKNSGAGGFFSIPGKGKSDKPESKLASRTVKGAGFEIPGQNSGAVASVTVPSKNGQGTVSHQGVQQEKSSVIASMPIYQTQTAPKEQNMNFGETTVLGGTSYGETTVLNETTVLAHPSQHRPQINAYIIRDKNKEKVAINKPRFRIGKEKSYVDYFIADNTAISRSHADIITSGNEFFIVDMNSTNHTFVNNEMIASGSEFKLTNGDNIRLANETFTFKVN